MCQYRISNNENFEEGDFFEDVETIERFWTEVEYIYEILKKWYEDVELYNYIGQVFFSSENIEDIIEVIKNYKNNNRYQFIEYLKEKILKEFSKDLKTIWPENLNIKPADNDYNIVNNKDYASIFGSLWFSGRKEEIDDNNKKNKEVVEDRQAVIKFLLWSNCEFLNKQLRNSKYEILRLSLEKENKQKKMKENRPFNKEIHMEMYRFPFDIFKINKPDIEHVDSYQDETEEAKFWEKEKNCIRWTYDILEILSEDERKKIKEEIKNIELNLDPNALDEVIKNIDSLSETKWKLFNEFDVDNYSIFAKCIKEKILAENIDKSDTLDKKWRDETIVDKRKIGNLNLLDPNINRGYGNKPYRLKRRDIIVKSTYGRYVYPCTKLVFLKEFDEKTANLQNWTEEDFKKYRNFLADMFFDCFFVNQQESDKKIKKELTENIKVKLTDIKLEYYNKILNKDLYNY